MKTRESRGVKAANLAQKPLIRNAKGACRESAAVGSGGGGQMSEAAVERERQYREACVVLELGQTKDPHMHYITLQWNANISGIRAGVIML